MHGLSTILWQCKGSRHRGVGYQHSGLAYRYRGQEKLRDASLLPAHVVSSGNSLGHTVFSVNVFSATLELGGGLSVPDTGGASA